MRFIFAILFFVFTIQVVPEVCGQSQSITLEGIWKGRKFNPKRVPGFRFMNDGVHYTLKAGDNVLRYSIVTGEVVDTLFNSAMVEAEGFSGSFNSYEFSEDEGLMLIKCESEAIYRRSTKAYFYTFDRASGEFNPVFAEGKIMHCTFSPDGMKGAFVYDNDLYWKAITSAEVTQVTQDGNSNPVINGSADWVYEEEFGFTKAFQWSPDSRKIGYYRFAGSSAPCACPSG